MPLARGKGAKTANLAKAAIGGRLAVLFGGLESASISLACRGI
jgi:hypothetical protein